MNAAAPEPLLSKITRVNARVGELLQEARRALRGERLFGVEHVRELSQHVAEMAPVWAQAPELRLSHPEMEDELDLYKSQLVALSSTLHQIRLMLLAHRSQMEASRAQLAAVSHWADALMQTR